MKKILLMIMFILNIFSFSKEIPHKYIYDNPEKIITTTETLKRKPNGSEMNISVTKFKSKEFNDFMFDNNKLIIITKNLKNLKNLKIFDNNKKSISYILKDKYIIINLNSIKTKKIFIKNQEKYYKLDLLSALNKVDNRATNQTINEEITFEINDKYSGGFINFYDGIYPNGIKVISSNITKHFPKAYTYNSSYTESGSDHDIKVTSYGFNTLNSDLIFVNGTTTNVKHIPWNVQTNGRNLVKYNNVSNINIGNGIILSTMGDTYYRTQSGKRHNGYSKLLMKFATHPKKTFTFYLKQNYLDFSYYNRIVSGNRNKMPRSSESIFKYYTLKINIIYKPDTLIGNSNLIFNENYNKSYINFNTNNNSLGIENSVPGLNFTTSGKGISQIQQNDVLEINGIKTTIQSSNTLTETFGNVETLHYKYKVENGKLRFALTNWGTLESKKTLNIKVLKNGSEKVKHSFIIQAPKKIEGNSRILFKEYYPKDTYITFNSVNINSPIPLSLENSIRDVILESSNQHGIITMKQGDILDINGIKTTIGSSGNLSEKIQNIDTTHFKYKVENGKLRFALTNWGTFEPRRDITIKVIRGTNEISKHILNIKSPVKLDGTTKLKFNTLYQIKKNVQFNGIDLNSPSDLSIVKTEGVTLESTIGAGIPYMNKGDKILIGDSYKRSLLSYEIGNNGNLDIKKIKLTNGEIGISTESGKLRVALLNWIVNKNIALNIKIIRGTNEIMNHTFNFKSPNAPFEILNNDDLDFGTLITGMKNKKAEANIKIKMLKDVSDIKFNLNTTSPEMTNEHGNKLNAKNLSARVIKQSNNNYLIKITGELDVPQNQKLGQYNGSAIVEMLIK